MRIVHYLVLGLSYFTLVLSFLPLVRNQTWFVRIFDYPRAQKFWLNVLLLVSVIVLFDLSASHTKILTALMVVNQIYLLRQIWPYLPIAGTQMKRNKGNNSPSVKLLIANVYQDNKKVERCIKMIKHCNPDIFILVEVDKVWAESIACFKPEYPFQVIRDQTNTYGMLLYSKLKLINAELRFLVENDIPSIKADVIVGNGDVFRLYALHPRPPVPQESETSEERDAEILMIGKEAKKSSLPVIVAGDLNDVAWSHTTRLFLKISGLLDPRRGRGFYNTFYSVLSLSMP